MPQRPTAEEIQFLNHAYNFFYDLYDEMKVEDFWNKDHYYRFSRVRDAFLVYSEVLEYEPVGWFLEALKKHRPPMEAELSKEFFQFVRNVLIHFPFFKSWDEVKVTKGLINWSKPGRTIDKFLTRYAGHSFVKYRIWIPKDKKFEYVTISFPAAYDEKAEIYLKDMMPEREGMIFSLTLMKTVLDSQVEKTFPTDQATSKESAS
jgi:hypothetical protein